MRNDWKDIFLASTGRISRIPFVLGALVMVALTAAYEAVAGPTAQWITGWVVYPMLLHGGASVLAKRLHDRGRSGWWAAPVLLAVWVVWPYPQSWVQDAFAVILVIAILDLALMPGEAAPNMFGPNPLARRGLAPTGPAPDAAGSGTGA
jgi:uncharacterized membrane protein YhaH (DUF805 family)